MKIKLSPFVTLLWALSLLYSFAQSSVQTDGKSCILSNNYLRLKFSCKNDAVDFGSLQSVKPAIYSSESFDMQWFTPMLGKKKFESGKIEILCNDSLVFHFTSSGTDPVHFRTYFVLQDSSLNVIGKVWSAKTQSYPDGLQWKCKSKHTHLETWTQEAIHESYRLDQLDSEEVHLDQNLLFSGNSDSLQLLVANPFHSHWSVNIDGVGQHRFEFLPNLYSTGLQPTASSSSKILGDDTLFREIRMGYGKRNSPDAYFGELPERVYHLPKAVSTIGRYGRQESIQTRLRKKPVSLQNYGLQKGLNHIDWSNARPKGIWSILEVAWQGTKQKVPMPPIRH